MTERKNQPISGEEGSRGLRGRSLGSIVGKKDWFKKGTRGRGGGLGKGNVRIWPRCLTLRVDGGK